MLWTFKQHNFAGGRLDKELMGRQDLAQYFKGCSELRNFTITRQGNLVKRMGTDYVCSLGSGDSLKFRLVPIVYSKDNGYYMLLSGGLAYILSRDGIYSTGGWKRSLSGAYSISSGIADDYLEDFDYVQSGDTIFFVSNHFHPFTIVFDQSAMTLTRTELSFAETTHSAPTLAKATKKEVDGGTGSTTVKYKVSYMGDDGLESYPSDAVSVKYSLPWKSGGSITLTIYDDVNAEKAAKYIVYKDSGSGYGYIGEIGKEDIDDSGKIGTETHKYVGTFGDTYLNPDMAVTPPDENNRKTFSSSDEWPRVVAFYQQRLVLGSSIKEPFTFWMSCTGDLYNFSTHDSLREDDAITATLAATEMPEIDHAILCKELMLFTESGEWEISPVSGNAMSYKTISAKMQSSIGTVRRTKPIIIGDEIVFVDSSGERILATRYNYLSDGYESQDLTVLSQWIFRNNSIRRMAYRKNPDSTIHCVLSDGSIAVMVYMREHEVCAWTRYDLGGSATAIDVATAKNESNGCTEIMYLVKDCDGNFEIWRERDIVPYRTSNSVADFICMDRYKEIDDKKWPPIGMMIVELASGRVVPSKFTGALYEQGLACGWSFTSKFESVHPDAKQDGGETMQMEIQNATETKVRVIDSSSFSVGACSAPAASDKTVTAEPTFGGDGSISLVDVDARVTLSGTNAKDGRIRITHSGVWPLKILSVATTYQVEAANQNGGGDGN